ncbi:ABC transporter substrate-binding protein [Actinokineospora soli]|uniref:ABC transporter substrate-binding protein n=1 Tax=Actinokineospora soli TaxID=1048753 RepID=A0ABW2TNC0_9PSEU
MRRGTTPATGDGAGSASNAPAAEGPWEFTDDRGTKISLPERPKRIVAQVHAAAALWDFGVKPVGVFGPQRTADGKPDPQVGNVDLAAVTSVGAEFGEFNLEQYANLEPDLVVTIMYGPVLWYVPDDSKAKIEEIAPTVGIRLDGKSASEAIARFGELAASLGADLNAPAVTQAKADFEKAGAELTAAAKEKPGLGVELAIGQQDGFWVADPKWHGDAILFSELGLEVVAPKQSDPTFGFEQLSWEQAAKYPADLVLEDARTVGMSTDELAAKYPTWSQLPAVKAGQVGAWHAETPSSYQLYAKVLTELTGTVKNARADVVK